MLVSSLINDSLMVMHFDFHSHWASTLPSFRDCYSLLGIRLRTETNEGSYTSRLHTPHVQAHPHHVHVHGHGHLLSFSILCYCDAVLVVTLTLWYPYRKALISVFWISAGYENKEVIKGRQSDTVDFCFSHWVKQDQVDEFIDWKSTKSIHMWMKEWYVCLKRCRMPSQILLSFASNLPL